MKLGLIADVRSLLAPLQVALELLESEGCDAVACLGSTVEGTDEDEAVLARLSDAGATLLASPHDAEAVRERLSAREEHAGLDLQHATEDDLPFGETLWASGSGVPDILAAAEVLRASPRQAVRGDWFEALALVVPEEGPPVRRLFLHDGDFEVPAGSFVTCPGSVAVARSWTRGGTVMTWDDAARRLAVRRFTTEGPVGPQPVRVLVYCDDFEPHRPETDVLEGVELEVKDDADAVVDDVASFSPDLVLLDYHLAGELSGLDALIALRPSGAELTVPVFTIAGNPADQSSMKDLGAYGQLPRTYLKDSFTRLLREVGAGS